MLNLAVMLEQSARTTPDRAAVVLGDRELTYRQVDAMACQVANLLTARGVQPGDKVALSCPNLPYFPVIYYGILKAGAVVVPLNVLLKGREIAYHLRDSDARAYFCFEGTPDLPMGEQGHAGFSEVEGCEHFVLITADPTAPSTLAGVETLGQALAAQSPTFATAVTEATDTAVILYTSGTTGQAKGAELTHANMVLNALCCHRMFGNPDPFAAPDTYLLTLPLFHSFGQTVLMNSGFGLGATLVMLPRFDARAALGLMAKHGVTLFAGVPTMYWALLGADRTGIDVSAVGESLRLAVAGGAPLPVEIHRKFGEQFGVTILEGYGLSETSPVASFSQQGQPPRVGSVGTPIWGIEMGLIRDDWSFIPPDDVDAVGEIAIRGDNIMKGYYKRPAETAAVLRDGWFRTGDLGKRDADGWYYIVDRSKDMIIRGGFNVYPREIEEVLLTHPEVSLAAVVGVAHPEHGEEIKAYVVRAPGATVTEEQLVAWAKDTLAAYKYPRIIEFRDGLPMTATGKILKRELRAATA